jgi:hypothetical protein
VKDIGKLGRKTGTAMWLVTQVPSLEELGSQVLRSMLRGGSIICLCTADRVSAGMLGLPADPHDIPSTSLTASSRTAWATSSARTAAGHRPHRHAVT